MLSLDTKCLIKIHEKIVIEKKDNIKKVLIPKLIFILCIFQE